MCMNIYFVGQIVLIFDKFASHCQCMGIFSAMLYIHCCFNVIFLFFKTSYRLMQVRSIAECCKGSILKYV